MSLVFPKASLERSNEAQGASSEYILPLLITVYALILVCYAPNLLIRQENPYLSCIQQKDVHGMRTDIVRKIRIIFIANIS